MKNRRRRRQTPVAKTTKDSAPTPDLHQPPPPGSDDFAYVVATYAWRDGLTANAIARKLGMQPIARNLMQVKRALRRAHDKFLRLVPRPHLELQKALMGLLNSGRRPHVQIHVVDDFIGATGGPVYAKAAEVVSNIVLERLSSEGGQANFLPDVVICNGGGRTVSEVVRALDRNPPLLHDVDESAQAFAHRLLFVAANAAHIPEQFDLSANFLAVTMARLFGAKHFALTGVEYPEVIKAHRAHVERTALFICGAGTATSGLLAGYFAAREWQLPEDAVGDIAFNLVDADGRPIGFGSEDARHFMEQINPAANLMRLTRIRNSDRVLLILDSDPPEAKRQIGIALLRQNYASDVVLGTRLAKAILEGFRD